MRVSVALLMLGLTVTACGPQQPDATTASSMRGHYIWGPEVNVFSPCGSGQEHWAVAEPEVMEELQARYNGFELPVYEAVYIEVRGDVGPVLDCGFCDQYDGSVDVKEILTVESPGPADCVTEMAGGDPSADGR